MTLDTQCPRQPDCHVTLPRAATPDMTRFAAGVNFLRDMKKLTLTMRAAHLLSALLYLLLAIAPSEATEWDDVVATARGQTVYFNAWAGSDKINAYIAWVGLRVKRDYGVTLRHVKIDDAATVVSRVLAEKTAGRDSSGSVDLVWINGENFAAMKTHGLLHGPFAEDLPNFRLVDVENKPTVRLDFTVPVEGLEVPWGMAQVVFIHDTARTQSPPRSIISMLDWARANPGRLTYPEPPNFTGTTFLKQALIELTPDPSVLQHPTYETNAAEATAPLWSWLNQITPYLWRQGRTYPANREAQRQLLDDGEVDISLSFEPAGASSAIARGLLSNTVRTYILNGGTIGNTHFVAIPYNSAAKEGAMVVANILLSPEAQAHKQRPEIWGDFTVLAMNKLSRDARRRFSESPLGVATLTPEELAPTLPEPHPSWTMLIETEWRRRMSR